MNLSLSVEKEKEKKEEALDHNRLQSEAQF